MRLKLFQEHNNSGFYDIEFPEWRDLSPAGAIIKFILYIYFCLFVQFYRTKYFEQFVDQFL